MGEAKGSKFEPDFNRAVKIEFSDHRITSNAGVLLLREADFKLKLTSSTAAKMIDTREQSAIRYQLGIIRNEHEDVQGSYMDLGRFQSQVLKARAMVIKHSRCVVARVARLWGEAQ